MKKNILITGATGEIAEALTCFALENIVSEKNYEYYGRKFQIILSDCDNIYSCFSKINLAIFNYE